jgi:hypothetical protein
LFFYIGSLSLAEAVAEMKQRPVNGPKGTILGAGASPPSEPEKFSSSSIDLALKAFQSRISTRL